MRADGEAAVRAESIAEALGRAARLSREIQP
jgi:hypothetical protein